jgi:hypothetical protein
MIDEAKLEAFIDRFIGDAAATAHVATIVLGDKLGFYKALAGGGPQSANKLALRSGCHPRLVEEWLNAQAASEYCEYDPEGRRYSLTSDVTWAILSPPRTASMMLSPMTALGC